MPHYTVGEREKKKKEKEEGNWELGLFINLPTHVPSLIAFAFGQGDIRHCFFSPIKQRTAHTVLFE